MVGEEKAKSQAHSFLATLGVFCQRRKILPCLVVITSGCATTWKLGGLPNTSSFFGTNPIGELITSGFPVTAIGFSKKY
jgi:hypothetical protein